MNQNWITKWKEDVEKQQNIVEIAFHKIMQTLKDLVDADLRPKGAYEVSGFSYLREGSLVSLERNELIQRIKSQGLFVVGPLPYRDGGDTYAVGTSEEACNSLARKS